VDYVLVSQHRHSSEGRPGKLRKLYSQAVNFLQAGQAPNFDVKINNCVMKAPAGSALMQYCYSKASEMDPETLKWGQTGPILLTRAVTRFALWRAVAEPQKYCPISWWEWYQVLNGALPKKTLVNASAVHLWNEMWKRNDVDKQDEFPKECYYEELKEKYLRE
jgi:hypothetical protein